MWWITVCQKVFDVDESDIARTRALYQKQCPLLLTTKDSTEDLSSESEFMRVLAVGLKNKLDYLLHLVDDFSRSSVEHIDEYWSVLKWSRNHKHFAEVSRELSGSEHFSRTACGAVMLFQQRFAPQLSFRPHEVIDDSLEETVKCITSAFNFVAQVLETHDDLLVPFQFDLCFVFGKPKFVTVSHYVGNEGDDDDDGETGEWKYFSDDVVGNIEARLSDKDLRYYQQQTSCIHDQMFAELFRGFLSKNGLQNSFLRRKRIISIVDRRSADSTPMWMFEPPSNCRDIPENAVPEWYCAVCVCC